jgi:hypothetical protein
MGELTEIVNTGVTVLNLVANSAGTATADSYANGLPHGVSPDDLSGWREQRVVMQWKHTSDWYEFWEVDMDFTVGMNFMYNGNRHGTGKFVDQITATLDVAYLPPDFTLKVTANFPQNGLNVGTDDEPIGALRFHMIVELKGMLGHLVAWTRNLNCLAQGDGHWEMA